MAKPDSAAENNADSAAGSNAEYVTIARVVRPRGIKGEVLADDFSDSDERFAAANLVARDENGALRPIVADRVWRHDGRLVLKFQGVDTISDAEKLRGAKVQLPAGDLGSAPEGEYFLRDLIGCEVVEAETERNLGRVTEILEPRGALLLRVDCGGEELLIPFAREICVDIAPREKRIRVSLPEGLEQLNR